MNHRRKGQGEVVGLLVIVILLLFIGILFLRFYLAKPATSLATTRTSLEASHILQALLQAHIGGEPFSQLADDCYTDKSTCQALQQEVAAIFQAILREGQQYSFSLSSGGEDLISMDNCQTGVVSSYSFLEAQIFYDATLQLC